MSPIPPTISVLTIVAILLSRMIESVFRPVNPNPGCERVTGISAGDGGLRFREEHFGQCICHTVSK
jgi:hypothetical protein